MHHICRTQLKRSIMRAVVLAAAVLAVVLAAVFLLERNSDLIDQGELQGAPAALEERYGYTELSPQGLCTVRLCGNPLIDNKEVYLYLTNLPSNAHLIRAEIYEAAVSVNDQTGAESYVPGKLLGRTGFIHPGTYVEELTLNKPLAADETRVYIKIALRNAETGQSEGYFYLGTILCK